MKRRLIGILCAVAAFYGAISVTAHADYFGPSLATIVGLLGTGSTAQTNLGLGSASLANTGTSGAVLCPLNGNCALSGNLGIGSSASPSLPLVLVYPVTTSTPAREMQFSDNTNTTLAMFASSTFAQWTSNNGLGFSSNNSTTPQFYVAANGAVGVGTMNQTGQAGELAFGKTTASGTAPGAGNLKLAAVAGTNTGTCKIIAYAGTSTTPSTILDNIGSGC